MNPSIGIIGGTGRQGSALAKRCAIHDYQVRIGSRSSERGEKAAKSLNEELGTDLISGGDNEYACNADIIVLAIPFDQVESLISPYLSYFKDKIVLDMTVNLEFGKYIKTHLKDGKSSYEFIRQFLPNSNVVACLKTISFSLLGNMEPLNQSDFQMTTSEEAYEFSSQLVEKFGLTPVRIKGKIHAHTIERMVALSIQINKEYKGSHTGFKLTNVNI